MEQKEKDLLLKDLCARLPYAIIGLYSWKNREPYNRELTGSLFDELKSSWDSTEDSQFLPYLRPMSSMTEEEREEYEKTLEIEYQDMLPEPIYHKTLDSYYYLLEHHFDFLGLIPAGFAIAVTEENNPYKV